MARTWSTSGVATSGSNKYPLEEPWLKATRYDVVCLQELKTSDEKFG